MAGNPLDGFIVNHSMISFVGNDLQRPESVLAERNGSLWCSDLRGGATHIAPDGTQTLVLPKDTDPKERADSAPNGLALTPQGDLIIADIGLGQIEILGRSGEHRVILDNIEGRSLGCANFVLRDSRDRLWVSVSTPRDNWAEAIDPKIRDGYIALFDGSAWRVVADGFAFTNEIRLDANEEWLYVVETCGPNITRLRVGPDGTLSQRQLFGPAQHGAFIDGIAFDAYGNLWGTHIHIDRIFAITPEGELRIILDDSLDVQNKEDVVPSFHRGELDLASLADHAGKIAPSFSSVAFGGEDLKTVHIGSLAGTRIASFRSPVAGLPMRHW